MELILLLVSIAHTHLWIEDVNKFVKICTYKDPRGSHYEETSIWIEPDKICPLSINKKE